MLFSGSLNPETYAPVLLRRRAAKLQAETGKVYRSMYDLHPMFAAPLSIKMKAALLRPFLLLIKEPICLLFALYMSVVYGFLCRSLLVSYSADTAHFAGFLPWMQSAIRPGSSADSRTVSQTPSSAPSRSCTSTLVAGAPVSPASPSSPSVSACSG